MTQHHGAHQSHSKRYRIVWGILLLLTLVTVEAASFDFGNVSVAIAMLIATIKGALVSLYFMHLKEERRLNQVVFVSGFVFLAIFVGITAADELFRPQFAKADVVAVEPPAAQQAAAVRELLVATPALLSEGKQVYASQCVACHGAEGKGDGPAAAALNPPPRNFTSGVWKLGGTPAQVFNTVSKGSPGTAMPPFGSLSLRLRWAVAHYVRSFAPHPPDDTAATLQAAGIQLDVEASSGEVRPTLPVDFAIERLIDEGEQSR